MGRPRKVVPPRKPNPLKNIGEVKAPPLRRPSNAGETQGSVVSNYASSSGISQSKSGAPQAPNATANSAIKQAPKRPKRKCPNKECDDPQVEDGVCHNCGTIIDDTNIVSEIQFGENASGAAVVQGSFVGPEQGTAKSLGPAFRKVGGSESHETALKEGKRIMQSLANQLNIPEAIVNSGTQIYKLAVMYNFIQGRRTDMVCAVCLYSACRKEKPCRVMLIDFADKVQVNVFKLGHTFKALHKNITLAKDGIMPVLPEDLIYRFAMKLEFGLLTSKVAEDAVRMVHRMNMDWIVMGRRPSGICGACLILAARMNNFRRTLTEVVYIVKVTVNTIQKRLDEFKVTPSSALTVADFLNNEFLESAHDPPSFYQVQPGFVKKQKNKKRKRKAAGGNAEIENQEHEADCPTKTRKDADGFAIPALPAGAASKKKPVRHLDANGFAIPPLPTPSPSQTPEASEPNELRTSPQLPTDRNLPIEPDHEDDEIDPEIDGPQLTEADLFGTDFSETTNRAEANPMNPTSINAAIEEQSGTSFARLVEQYGDNSGQDDGSDEEEEEEEAAEEAPAPKKRGRPSGRPVHVPDDWARSEEELENQISEMVNDPNSDVHAAAFAVASRLSEQHIQSLLAAQPDRNINMDVHIGVDEFANDYEVANCKLPLDEVLKKEKIWVNNNKTWLRQQQVKQYQKKLAAAGPPKATRNRTKKPRIGEAQTSPANTPAEAAIEIIKLRSHSKKLNYKAIESMFPPGIGTGSLRTSAATSQAESASGGDSGRDSGADSNPTSPSEEPGASRVLAASSVADTQPPAAAKVVSFAETAEFAEPPEESTTVNEGEEEEEEEEEDPTEELDDWKAALRRPPGSDEEEEDDYDMDEVNNDMDEMFADDYDDDG